MKTQDLTGLALDWAVAKAEGGTDLWYDTVATWWVTIDGKNRALGKGWAQLFMPSTVWAQGGAIIERRPYLLPYLTPPHRLHLGKFSSQTPACFEYSGPTPLVAAMRAHVATELGDEVDVPEGLL